MFQGSLKGVPRMFLGCFKEVIKGESQGCLNKVSSVFQENFKQSFKGVSSMFQCFSILLLPGSHRSYPSIWRACFFLIIHSIFYLLAQYCNPTIAFIRLLNFPMKQEFKPFCCLIVITLSMSRAMERSASLSDGCLSWFSLYLN